MGLLKFAMISDLESSAATQLRAAKAAGQDLDFEQPFKLGTFSFHFTSAQDAVEPGIVVQCGDWGNGTGYRCPCPVPSPRFSTHTFHLKYHSAGVPERPRACLLNVFPLPTEQPGEVFPARNGDSPSSFQWIIQAVANSLAFEKMSRNTTTSVSALIVSTINHTWIITLLFLYSPDVKPRCLICVLDIGTKLPFIQICHSTYYVVQHVPCIDSPGQCLQ